MSDFEIVRFLTVNFYIRHNVSKIYELGQTPCT